MAIDIGFEVSEDLAKRVYQLIERTKADGKLKKGSNEVTKSIERGEALLVVVAGDTAPEEIVMHLPILCKDKDVPLIAVPSKDELGASCGLPVSTTTVAVVKAGDKALLDKVVKQIAAMKSAPKSEKPAEKEAQEETKEEPAEQEPEEESEAEAEDEQ